MDILNIDFELDLSAFDPMEEIGEGIGADVQPEAGNASDLPTLEYFPRWHDAKASCHREVLDSDALSALMKRVHVCNIAQRMYDQGWMGEESFKEGFFHLWETSARKQAAKALTAEYINHMRDVARWLDEFQPTLPTIVETGLASVELVNLGKSSASKASRKIRDWYKVTRYTRTRALERGDSKAFIDALAFVQALLEGYMNTRYWAIIENARSVEARALGQRDVYNATGKPKSSYKLVMHNQLGETVVSPALKRVQPAGRVDAHEGIYSPETASQAVMPFPKVVVKKKRI